MCVMTSPISSMWPITSSRLTSPREPSRRGTSASGVPTASVLTSANGAAASRHTAAGADS